MRSLLLYYSSSITRTTNGKTITTSAAAVVTATTANRSTRNKILLRQFHNSVYRKIQQRHQLLLSTQVEQQKHTYNTDWNQNIVCSMLYHNHRWYHTHYPIRSKTTMTSADDAAACGDGGGTGSRHKRNRKYAERTRLSTPMMIESSTSSSSRDGTTATTFLQHREQIAQELLHQYDQILFHGTFLNNNTKANTAASIQSSGMDTVSSIVSSLHQQLPQQPHRSIILPSPPINTTATNCEPTLSLPSPQSFLPTNQANSIPTSQSSSPSSSVVLVTIKWSHRLRTTAGRAHLLLHTYSVTKKRRSTTKQQTKSNSALMAIGHPSNIKNKLLKCGIVSNRTKTKVDSHDIDTIPIPKQQREPHNDSRPRRTAVIELSYKVIDDIYRLQTTLLHELCHVAAWILDHVCKPPHGTVFKKYVQYMTNMIQPIIPITTKHHFVIHYKYAWECTNDDCSNNQNPNEKKMIRRHSRRSINIKKHVCGKCRSPLREITIPSPIHPITD